jgi:hypothetical protein
MATPNETASGLIYEMKRRAELNPLSGLNDRRELLPSSTAVTSMVRDQNFHESKR